MLHRFLTLIVTFCSLEKETGFVLCSVQVKEKDEAGGGRLSCMTGLRLIKPTVA
jgi:hypothetical protein